MAFVAVAATVGGAVGLGAGTAAVIGGGALIGAGVGGLYSAVTGDGDILNSMLTGGLIGGAGAFGLKALGVGGAGAGAAGMGGGTGLTSSAAAAAPSTAAIPTANVLTPTAAQIAGSTAAPIGTAGQAASGFGLSAAPAKSAFGTLAAPTSTTATQMASNLGAKTLTSGMSGSKMLGYGLAGSAAMQLLGGSGPGAQAPASATYPGDIRPYDFAARPTSAAGQAQFARSQYDSAGNPILNTQEQRYFDQGFAPLQAYRAGTANPNPTRAAQGGLMGAYPMEKYGDTIPNREAYGVGMAQGGGIMAAGGQTSSLGGYSDGGRLLKGPGDGVSDNIPAVIGNKQPARLADGEFVIPARIVSEIGNGSTDAGAKRLYAMMDKIQAGRKKTVGKGKVAVDSKAMKHLPA